MLSAAQRKLAALHQHFRGRFRPPAYCVGLPKCGTHSLVDMLAPVLRVRHEPLAEELLGWMARLHGGGGRAHSGELHSYFLKRHRRLRLEFESSHLLGDFVPTLVELFPRARFVLVVRQCRPWLDSIINDQINLRRWERYPIWATLYDHYFGAPGASFAPAERLLRDLDLYPLENYLRYWRRQIEFTLSAVPPHRLLTLRTDELQDRGPQLADFLGVPAQLLAHRSHSYKAPLRHGVLARIDPAHVDRTVDKICGDLQRRLFPSLPQDSSVTSASPA